MFFWATVRYYKNKAGRELDKLICKVRGHQPKMYWCRRCGAENEGKWRKDRFGRWR